MVTVVGWSAGGSPARTGLLNGMELDLTEGQSHGYVRRKVAQANGRAGDGAAGEEATMNTMLNQVADGVHDVLRHPSAIS